MTTAPEYLKMLAEARQNKDEKKIRDISMEITELDTSYPENLSAQFRLASVVLNDDGDAVLALKILEKIVKSGVDSPDVEQARIMYSICLWGAGKQQLAVFELRKVLSAASEPSIHSSLALDYLVTYMEEMGSSEKELKVVNNKRIEQLSALSHSVDSLDDKAGYALRLATCLEQRGDATDLEHAKKIYDTLVKEKGNIDELTVTVAQDAIKRLRKAK